MFGASRFFQGLILGFVTVAIFYLVAYIVLSKNGEISLDSVVDRQMLDSHREVLFLSGLSQHAFNYKMQLMDASKPQVVAIGSSRAMQVREQFFRRGFTNLGGAVNSIAELEVFALRFAKMEDRPKLALLFVDPWWFNSEFVGQGGGYKPPDFPTMISNRLVFGAGTLLRKGNWISAATKSKNLGIQAILTGNGFSYDGSYHYVGISSGFERSADIRFLDTLARVTESRSRFEKSDHADLALIRRACAAISMIKKQVNSLVLIAPPFSKVVWNKMREGGYNYIDEVTSALARCSNAVDLYDFYSVIEIPEGSDCEFIDGFHGGDVTYARILKLIGQANSEVRKYLAIDFLDNFINDNSGYSGGITRHKFSEGKEVDFLQIGCGKS